MKSYSTSAKYLAAALAALAFAAGPSTSSAQSSPKPTKHKFTLKGSGLTIRQDEWVTSEVDLSSDDTEGKYTLLDETWLPGFYVPPHFHKGHNETFHILDGQVEWTVAGERHVMGKGDTVYIPANTIHTVKVVGTTPVKTLMWYDPAGYEDHMIRQDKYTKEQREEPAIKEELRRLNDFNIPAQ